MYEISYDFVLFGSLGNVSTTKILPAIANARINKRLPANVRILLVDVKEIGQTALDVFLTELGWSKELSTSLGTKFVSVAKNYDELRSELVSRAADRVVIYLATGPKYFSPIARELDACKLLGDNSLLIVEKPVGSDLATCQEIHRNLQRHCGNYACVDHFLGKEPVRNLIDLRKSSLFGPRSRRQIADVQVLMLETVGVAGRAEYYDESGGALRDMIQNHAMQLVSLLAMNAGNDDVRARKIDVMRKLRPFTDRLSTDVVRGQYGPGNSLAGYLQEPGVPKHSTTETLAGLNLMVETKRWEGKPFRVVTAKRMSRRQALIQVRYRSKKLLPDFIDLDAVAAGEPGDYESLVLAGLRGDMDAFVSAEEQELSWGLLAPIQRDWASSGSHGLEVYPAGSDLDSTSAAKLLKLLK